MCDAQPTKPPAKQPAASARRTRRVSPGAEDPQERTIALTVRRWATLLLTHPGGAQSGCRCAWEGGRGSWLCPPGLCLHR